MSMDRATMAPNASNGTPEVRIEMRSNPLYLSGAREMLAAVARRLGFSEEACGQIALAVDEALCNVIRHGYERASDRPIWISLWPVCPGAAANGGAKSGPPRSAEGCVGADSMHGGAIECQTEALRIIIEDEAKQVDPTTIKSRNLDDVRPGGLGVHIIRAVMDEVTYEKREKAGMRLTMIKKRTDAPIGGHAAGSCGPCGCAETAPKEAGRE